MKIGKHIIGSGFSFIIAEAGVNHNGDFKNAKRLVDIAVEAGCNCVKFQTFKTSALVSKKAHKSGYQLETTDRSESQADMLKKLELTYEEFIELKNYCDQKGIVFMSTPFDSESADFLNSIGVEAFKLPSSEITNLEFIKLIASYGKPIILSTGMCDLLDVSRACQILNQFAVEYALLHCVSEYPSKDVDTNLKAMKTLSTAFQVPIGYSDHTLGISIPIASAALEAAIIEKHFTLDKTLEGPDHRASLEPKELSDMVKGIRSVELALGDGLKRPTKTELENSEASRKSLVAKQDLKKGTKLTTEMLNVKRPGNGIAPYLLDFIVGLTLTKDLKEDEVLTEKHLK